jgi:hypothetical protein
MVTDMSVAFPEPDAPNPTVGAVERLTCVKQPSTTAPTSLIATTGQQRKNAISIARQGGVVGQESGPLSGPDPSTAPCRGARDLWARLPPVL